MRRTLTTMSGAQLRMARAALRWAITDLAVQANVSPTTIGRIEANLAAHRSTLDTLQKVFEQMGVVFVRHKDGDGIRVSHAGECVGDLVALADTAVEPAATGPAIRARIDRYLRAARAWQKAWRAKDGVYVSHLKEAICTVAPHLEPPARAVLAQALVHLDDRTRSSLSPQA